MKKKLHAVVIIISALIIFSSFYQLIGRIYVQKSSSMIPLINENDRVFILKSKNIKRFDIICFSFTQNGSTFPILKRVIAFSGEKIAISNGEIKIDNNSIMLPPEIDVKYLSGTESYPIKYGSPGNYIVPSGELFVIGDNTNFSYDSRYFGGVPINKIIGKAIWLLRYL
jgi:signal peptidase I